MLSSSGTDTYAAISSAIGALKGPKHGGANLKVMHQLDYNSGKMSRIRPTTTRSAIVPASRSSAKSAATAAA
ncbi:citrate/2-methylcitrate synthase [Gemmiger formicilis]|uniref:citrate/2-methylcitrate synthase n=1 Tax=Gemmiger formicilis TaxID=745368 RepID=UPI0035210E94